MTGLVDLSHALRRGRLMRRQIRMLELHFESLAHFRRKFASGEPLAALVAVFQKGPHFLDRSRQDADKLDGVVVDLLCGIVHEITFQSVVIHNGFFSALLPTRRAWDSRRRECAPATLPVR